MDMLYAHLHTKITRLQYLCSFFHVSRDSVWKIHHVLETLTKLLLHVTRLKDFKEETRTFI